MGNLVPTGGPARAATISRQGNSLTPDQYDPTRSRTLYVRVRAPMRSLAVAFALTALSANAQSVLQGRFPTRAEGAARVERLNDGVTAVDGDAWDGPGAVLLPTDVSVEWDLGRMVRITGAAIQADNNDEYLISVSGDGSTWHAIARFGGVEGAGLRTRSDLSLDATARFVRLTASGGDGRFSVSELEVFENGADDSLLLRARWVPRRPLEQLFTTWVLFMSALLALASRRLSRTVFFTLAALGLSATAWLMFKATPADPQALQSLPWARAAVALVALFAVVREWLWRSSWPSHPRAVVGTLGVTAVMGFWCFLNLGSPQFFDVGERRGTWLHHYDMRTYYPIAKYFPELRFDGVYAASVVAVAEGRSLDQFDGYPIRDLRTHVLTNVRDAKQHLLAVRARFTDERWALFQQDMNYFRRAMGDGGFLGSMNDHGGNATPVWFLAARALFSSAPASDATLWRGVVADMALLALAFAMMWWAWGARTALLAMTVFGAMDFYQFGSNWFGAALRHDWLSLWAIGLALLRKEKWAWAGAAFAWSAWIRAFPALTFVTMSFPVLWVGTKLLLQKKTGDALNTARPLLRVVLGVGVASAVLLGLSIWVFGADAWTEWLRKVQTLDKDNHLNNISFRTYVSIDKTVWRVTLVATLLGLLVTLRRASLVRAAAWGVALVPIVFNPANYYLHAAFLLVTLAAEQSGKTTLRGLLVWCVTLLMCVGSYFTNIPSDTGVHFRLDTLVCFATLGVLLVLEVRRPRGT